VKVSTFDFSKVRSLVRGMISAPGQAWTAPLRSERTL